MEKTKEKTTVILSIAIAFVFLMVSFTSTVAFQSVHSFQKEAHSPLFYQRLKRIIQQGEPPSIHPLYLGKDSSLQIPLPVRELLTQELLDQLSTKEIKEHVRQFGNDIAQKWDILLFIAQNNLPEINRLIRQDYTEYQRLVNTYCAFSTQEAKAEFFNKVRALNLNDLNQGIARIRFNQPGVNITSGFFCNITSGLFCQITSQPICNITTQPICSLTKGFFCWTVYGPICPTTGIKCHPPTSRPTLCKIFSAAGALLKAVIIVLLLAAVIFIPLALLTLVLITVLNPQRCEQMREKITVLFNCTIPE